MDLKKTAKLMGSGLRDIRINHFNDTQKTMSTRVGVSLSTYGKMEHGDTNINLESWLRAASISGKLDAWGSLFANQSLLSMRPRKNIRQRVRK